MVLHGIAKGIADLRDRCFRITVFEPVDAIDVIIDGRLRDRLVRVLAFGMRIDNMIARRTAENHQVQQRIRAQAISAVHGHRRALARSEEHTSELQSLMRISYAVFCLNKKKKIVKTITINKSTITNTYQSTQKHHTK